MLNLYLVEESLMYHSYSWYIYYPIWLKFLAFSEKFKACGQQFPVYKCEHYQTSRQELILFWLAAYFLVNEYIRDWFKSFSFYIIFFIIIWNITEAKYNTVWYSLHSKESPISYSLLPGYKVIIALIGICWVEKKKLFVSRSCLTPETVG